MKKQVLILAFGVLSVSALQAQSVAQPPVRQSFGLPAALQQTLAARRVAAPARNTTVRKPGKSAHYFWSNPSWSATPTVDTYRYDAQGLTTQITEADSVTQQPLSRYSWTYNAEGSQTSSLTEEWQAGTWQNRARSTQVYNSANRPTEYLEQRWVNGAWQNVYRNMVQYDARNHYVGYVSEEWKNNAWVVNGAGRATLVYNANGTVQQETEETLDTSLNIYRPYFRRLFTYPSATALDYSVLVLQRWDNGAYVNSQRVTYVARDAQDRVTLEEYDEWINGAWQLTNRSATTFLPNGSTQGLYERRANNAWVGVYRYVHIYDEQGNELNNVSETFADNVWTVSEAYRYVLRYNVSNDLLAQVRQNYDPNTKGYTNAVKQTYGDYQNITLGVKPNVALAAQTQLYPNPTTGRTTLELAGLQEQAPVQAEVVNSLGQVVQRLTLPVRQGRLQQTLELSQQPAGVYSVQLHTSKGLVVKKVVRN